MTGLKEMLASLLNSLQSSLANNILALQEEIEDNPALWSLSDDDWDSFETAYQSPAETMGINPASGLPMCGESFVDSAGNPYGTDGL